MRNKIPSARPETTTMLKGREGDSERMDRPLRDRRRGQAKSRRCRRPSPEIKSMTTGSERANPLGDSAVRAGRLFGASDDALKIAAAPIRASVRCGIRSGERGGGERGDIKRFTGSSQPLNGG